MTTIRSYAGRSVVAVNSVCAVVLAGCVVMTLGPSRAFATEPMPFATATGLCTTGQISLPLQPTSHPDVVVHFRSLGAEGYLDYVGVDFLDGDSGYAPYEGMEYEEESVEAGIAPTLGFHCNSGSLEASLADRPSTPATFNGVSSPLSSPYGANSRLVFTAAGAGQYVVDVTVSQGAITIDNGGILESSSEYAVGALSAGDHGLEVRAQPGPPAIWTATVTEVPVVINGLTFGQECMAPGTGLPATFSVTGDTDIIATVSNAAGQTVRDLGTFPVKEGASSVAWDGRGEGGATLPDGPYTLTLVSTDPQGASTSARVAIVVTSAGPSVSMTSPRTIAPSQSVAFHVGDPLCGLASASVSIDGSTIGTFKVPRTEEKDIEELIGLETLPSNGNLAFSTREGWTSGTHHWSVRAVDKIGNVTDASGTFGVATAARAQCVVARVLGRSLASAKKALRSGRCRVGKITYERRRGARKGEVISEHPTGGARKPAECKVNLVVDG